MNRPIRRYMPTTPEKNCTIELKPSETVVLWRLLDFANGVLDAIPESSRTPGGTRFSDAVWELQALLSDQIDFKLQDHPDHAGYGDA